MFALDSCVLSLPFPLISSSSINKSSLKDFYAINKSDFFFMANTSCCVTLYIHMCSIGDNNILMSAGYSRAKIAALGIPGSYYSEGKIKH